MCYVYILNLVPHFAFTCIPIMHLYCSYYYNIDKIRLLFAYFWGYFCAFAFVELYFVEEAI